MRYDELPSDVDRSDVAAVVRDVIHLINREQTYRQIAETANRLKAEGAGEISENSIKQFVANNSARVSRSNNTVASLYHYVTRSWSDLETDVREYALLRFSKIKNYNITDHYIDRTVLEKLYRLNEVTIDLFQVNASAQGKLMETICGRFCLFRKSAEKSTVIIYSRIIIEYHPVPKTIVVLHITIDQDQTQKISFGIAYAKKDSIFFSLFMEDRSAAEFIVINNKPVGRLFSSFGFLETPDSLTRIVPVSARIFLLRQTEETANLDYRIDLTDPKYDTTKNALTKRILDAIDQDVARKIRS